jgi:hypothetical protein
MRLDYAANTVLNRSLRWYILRTLLHADRATSDCEEYCLLRFNAAYSGGSPLTFRGETYCFHQQNRQDGTQSSLALVGFLLTLKMEAICSPETSVDFYQITRCHILQNNYSSNLL